MVRVDPKIAKKAWRLRKQLRAGKALSPELTAWLAEYQRIHPDARTVGLSLSPPDAGAPVSTTGEGGIVSSQAPQSLTDGSDTFSSLSGVPPPLPPVDVAPSPASSPPPTTSPPDVSPAGGAGRAVVSHGTSLDEKRREKREAGIAMAAQVITDVIVDWNLDMKAAGMKHFRKDFLEGPMFRGALCNLGDHFLPPDLDFILVDACAVGLVGVSSWRAHGIAKKRLAELGIARHGSDAMVADGDPVPIKRKPEPEIKVEKKQDPAPTNGANAPPIPTPISIPRPAPSSWLGTSTKQGEVPR